MNNGIQIGKKKSKQWKSSTTEKSKVIIYKDKFDI